MKSIGIQIGIAIIALVLGVVLGQKIQMMGHSNKGTEKSSEKKPLYWVAPMNPKFKSDKPGKSPMGMDLVPVYADSTSEKMDPNAIVINPAVEQNLGVRTTTVKKRDLSRIIETVGYVMVDENKIEHIHPYIDGWVKNLSVKTTGEHVKKGQMLLELYSPTLVNAQEEYLLALKANSSSLVKASHKKLLTLGVSEKQIKELKARGKVRENIKIYSKQPGIVSELNIREGMYVKPDKDIMTLEDLSTIWVIGEVFERQSKWVKENQPAIATLPYLPGEKWSGLVDYVYPRLDPNTHALKVRLRFKNPSEALKPNMYADVKIAASEVENVLSIPREAVIYTGTGSRVIVSLGKGQYKAKPITVGFESGDYIVVLDGLQEGETVVTSAHFLIDSESSLKASFDRMDSSKEMKHEHKMEMPSEHKHS